MSRFAAIDVGSNAVRLMVARLTTEAEGPRLRKEAFYRVPLRLGADVFSQGRLSAASQEKLVKTLLAFRQLIDVFAPLGYRACATSALRDAANGGETVERAATQAGIRLEIIDGMEEAQLVFAAHVQDQLTDGRPYLFVDVGGGSTELLLFQNQQILQSASFNIGTVRMLQDAVDAAQWQAMQGWLRQHVAARAACAIGSGGNINRLNRIAGQDARKELSRKSLRRTHEQLRALSLEARMQRYGLKPDRADVIVPAGEIYLKVLEWGRIATMHVPKFGLTDGLIRQQYDTWCQTDGAAAGGR